MTDQTRNLKITFELNLVTAIGAAKAAGAPRGPDLLASALDISATSRHTVAVKFSEQRQKILDMQDNGYRVVSILTANHRELTSDGWR